MDASFIADVLGGVLRLPAGLDHEGPSIRLVNLDLSIKLRLDIAPDGSRVSLYVERKVRRSPAFVGVVTLASVESIITDKLRGEVRFVSDAAELLISDTGTFRMVTY